MRIQKNNLLEVELFSSTKPLRLSELSGNTVCPGFVQFGSLTVGDFGIAWKITYDLALILKDASGRVKRLTTRFGIIANLTKFQTNSSWLSEGLKRNKSPDLSGKWRTISIGLHATHQICNVFPTTDVSYQLENRAHKLRKNHLQNIGKYQGGPG